MVQWALTIVGAPANGGGERRTASAHRNRKVSELLDSADLQMPEAAVVLQLLSVPARKHASILNAVLHAAHKSIEDSVKDVEDKAE